MTLTIIAEQETYRQTLETALLAVDQDVRTYADEKEIKEQKSSLWLYVLSENNKELALKRSQSAPVFVIADAEVKDHDFINLFQMPVRLGAMAQSIVSYLKHKEQQQSLSPVTMGVYKLDPRTNQLMHVKNKKAIKLTEKEQDILLYLYAHKQKPVMRQELLDGVWGYAEDTETHTLETHIYRLRQKVEPDPAQPVFLMTNDDGYFLKLD